MENVIIKSAGISPVYLNGKLGDQCCCPAPVGDLFRYKQTFGISLCDAQKVRKGGAWSIETNCSYDESVAQYYMGGAGECGDPGSIYYEAYDRVLPSTLATSVPSKGCYGGFLLKSIGSVTREAGILTDPPYEISYEANAICSFLFGLAIGKKEVSISFVFEFYAARTFFMPFSGPESRPAGQVTINVLEQSYGLQGFARGSGNPAGAAPFDDPCNIGWEREEQFSTTINFNPTT